MGYTGTGQSQQSQQSSQQPIGLGSALGIAVGASTLTALMAAGIAFVVTRNFNMSSEKGPSASFAPLLSDEDEGGGGKDTARGEQRRRKERVAPQT